MDIAYLHVAINHLPIMGVPILLALLLLGMWSGSESIKRAALLGFVALGVATVAVFLAGKGGEDFVERLPDVSHDAIERHERMATVALVAVEGLALLSLLVFVRSGGGALLRRRGERHSARTVAAGAAGLVVLVAIAATGLLGYTGRLGGQIRHTEFAAGAQAATQAEGEDGKGRGRRGRDH